MLVAACLIAALNVFLAIYSLRSRPQRKNWDRKNVVHLPFYLAGVGMACGTILSVPTVVCATDQNWMFAFFGVMVLVCDSMMAAYLNCVIRFDDKGFETRNLFGISRSCSYAEVESIRSGRDIRIYFRGHSVLIHGISYGGDRFLDAVDKGHKKATGQWVPAYQQKWDPMNGHVDYPWFYLILWIVIGLFAVAMAVMAVYSITVATDPSRIITEAVQFSGYDISSGSLRLYIEGKEDPYLIDYYEDYGEGLPTPEQLCSGQVYIIGTKKNGRYLCSLADTKGQVYITPELERQIYRDNQRFAVWVIVAATPFTVWFCYMGIAVARHPERYSEKVRRLFYKDYFLH